MLNSIDDIIALHNSSGNIEDAYKYVHLDNKVFVINTYTLRFRKGNTTKEETRKWNFIINNELKKDRNLQKEIKEYSSVFEMFSKLKIKSGYIEKTESPDFYYTRDNKSMGIEVTKIYVGNEWVAEKFTDEIRAYKLRKSELSGYIEYKKYQNRIRTFNVRGGIAIMPVNDDVSIKDYVIEIKNKIFEKIRRLIDEYTKYDKNIIFVQIISPFYFDEENEIKDLNNEIKFYLEHLEEHFDEKEYKIVLKASNTWIEFDIKNGTYIVL